MKREKREKERERERERERKREREIHEYDNDNNNDSLAEAGSARSWSPYRLLVRACGPVSFKDKRASS